MKSKVLIIGSTGFIGRRVAEVLAKEGSLSIQGISSKDIDLLNKKDVLSKLPDFMKDATVLVTAAITPDKGGNSLEALRKNIEMDFNVAQAIGEVPIRHFIYISSTDAYGRNNLTLPLHEQSYLQPSNFYGLAKFMGETMLAQACPQKGIPFTVVRPGPIYGPGDTHQSPVQRFVVSAVQRETIKLIGTGEEVRDFIYIDDVAQAIKIIAQKKLTGAFNLVTAQSRTIKAIVEILEQLCGYPLETQSVAVNNDADIIYKEPRLLQYVPGFQFTSLEDGLRATWAYVKDRNHLAIPSSKV